MSQQPNITPVSAPTASSSDADFPGAWTACPTLILDTTMVPPAPDAAGLVYRNVFNTVAKLAAMARSIQGPKRIKLANATTTITTTVDFGTEWELEGLVDATGAKPTLTVTGGGTIVAPVKGSLRNLAIAGGDAITPIIAYSDASISYQLRIEDVLFNQGNVFDSTNGTTVLVSLYGLNDITGDSLATLPYVFGSSDVTGGFLVQAFDASTFHEATIEQASGGSFLVVESSATRIMDFSILPGTLIAAGICLATSQSDPNTIGVYAAHAGAFYFDTTLSLLWEAHIDGSGPGTWFPLAGAMPASVLSQVGNGYRTLPVDCLGGVQNEQGDWKALPGAGNVTLWTTASIATGDVATLTVEIHVTKDGGAAAADFGVMRRTIFVRNVAGALLTPSGGTADELLDAQIGANVAAFTAAIVPSGTTLTVVANPNVAINCHAVARQVDTTHGNSGH